MIYKSSWKLISIHIFVPNRFLVLWLTTLEFPCFCVTRHLHDGRVGLKVTYFGTHFGEVICYWLAIWTALELEQVLFRCFFSSSIDKFTLLYQNSVQMFLLVSGRHVGVSLFQALSQWGWSKKRARDERDLKKKTRWAPTWRLHTSLYKFEKKSSPHILHKKNCCDLNLGESLCIVTFFLFSDSGLGFDFHFDLFWMAWHWKSAIC